LHIEIPRLRTLAHHAGGHVLEATVVPVGLFYLFLSFVGIWAALAAGLAWSYVAVGRRLLTGQRVPGLLLLGALGLTARTLLAVATGSVFLYFLQPTLTTVVTAALFLVTLPTGRPMAERLAADFCPLPSGFTAHPGVRRFFNRLTLLWVLVQLGNAAITITLLLSMSVRTYVVTRTLISLVVTGGAIGFSTLWFRRSMRHHGVTVSYAR